MKKVIILAGGKSQEREVSLRSGQAVYHALQSVGYDCMLWDPKTDDVQSLLSFRPDAAFIALHGRYGEDGCIQGFLETLGIPYTGSGVAASAIGMNKQLTKKLLVYENLPTAPFILTNSREPIADAIQKTQNLLSFPVVVKAAEQGSSIGTCVAASPQEMETVLRDIYQYDDKAIIEQYIRGMEVTVAVIGPAASPQALPIIEIDYNHEKLWDYEAKYNAALFRHIIPARIRPELKTKLEEISLAVYQTLECRGFARVDFMIDEQETPYVLEVNTIPGCTETSLLPDAAKAAGISFPELVSRIVEESLQ